MVKIDFLGGAGTVTGSRFMVSNSNCKLLVDCGLFQGLKNLRLRNWQPFPISPESIDAIILTHAHIDHSGYIPRLVKEGFKGTIYCTPATLELCKILLPDSGYLQEEDARYLNRKQLSKHSPALPLYTQEDASNSIGQFRSFDYFKSISINEHANLIFRPAGHILGAATVELMLDGEKIVFSGDLGRYQDEVMDPPVELIEADHIVVESTYGNRLHPAIDPYAEFERIINSTAEKGGSILIPAFAVGRAQLLLHIITQLRIQKRIPDMPVFLNSPMSVTVTELFYKYHKLHRLSKEACKIIDENTHFVRSVEESVALNRSSFPCVIISASGMASGGRVLHHLKSLVSASKNCIIFAGFQAPGTRGEVLVNGADRVKIHGNYYPVRARIELLDSMSAHADYQEILRWLRAFENPPKNCFIVHGESAASDSLRLRVQDELKWKVRVPELGESFEL